MGNPIWEVHDLKGGDIDFCLPEFSVTKIVTWKCHADLSTNVIYDMILGRDLITALGLDLKFSGNLIISGEGPHEGCSSHIADVNNYEFKSITKKPLNRKNPL